MGDMIEIGPECFSSEDKSVVCWEGRNYIPQKFYQEACDFIVKRLGMDAFNEFIVGRNINSDWVADSKHDNPGAQSQDLH